MTRNPVPPLNTPALGLEANATGGNGVAAIFRKLAGELPGVNQVRESLLTRWQGKGCTSVAPRLILTHLAESNLQPVIAYATAWLEVAGGGSILPLGLGTALLSGDGPASAARGDPLARCRDHRRRLGAEDRASNSRRYLTGYSDGQGCFYAPAVASVPVARIFKLAAWAARRLSTRFFSAIKSPRKIKAPGGRIASNAP